MTNTQKDLQKIRQARVLINNNRHADARALIRNIDHDAARKLLKEIDDYKSKLLSTDEPDPYFNSRYNDVPYKGLYKQPPVQQVNQPIQVIINNNNDNSDYESGCLNSIPGAIIGGCIIFCIIALSFIESRYPIGAPPGGVFIGLSLVAVVYLLFQYLAWKFFWWFLALSWMFVSLLVLIWLVGVT